LLASNAAMMWRGMLFGATSIASKRMSPFTSSGCAARLASAVAMMRALRPEKKPRVANRS
jgi:hypothetical protein